jgi:hypothetical protein
MKFRFKSGKPRARPAPDYVDVLRLPDQVHKVQGVHRVLPPLMLMGEAEYVGFEERTWVDPWPRNLPPSATHLDLSLGTLVLSKKVKSGVLPWDVRVVGASKIEVDLWQATYRWVYPIRKAKARAKLVTTFVVKRGLSLVVPVLTNLDTLKTLVLQYPMPAPYEEDLEGLEEGYPHPHPHPHPHPLVEISRLLEKANTGSPFTKVRLGRSPTPDDLWLCELLIEAQGVFSDRKSVKGNTRVDLWYATYAWPGTSKEVALEVETKMKVSPVLPYYLREKELPQVKYQWREAFKEFSEDWVERL